MYVCVFKHLYIYNTHSFAPTGFTHRIIVLRPPNPSDHGGRLKVGVKLYPKHKQYAFIYTYIYATAIYSSLTSSAPVQRLWEKQVLFYFVKVFPGGFTIRSHGSLVISHNNNMYIHTEIRWRRDLVVYANWRSSVPSARVEEDEDTRSVKITRTFVRSFYDYNMYCTAVTIAWARWKSDPQWLKTVREYLLVLIQSSPSLRRTNN